MLLTLTLIEGRGGYSGYTSDYYSDLYSEEYRQRKRGSKVLPLFVGYWFGQLVSKINALYIAVNSTQV